MRRAFHLFLVIVTLWRALAGDVMAATWQQGLPLAGTAVVVEGAVATPPCHDTGMMIAESDPTATQLSGSGHSGCAACAICHMGALLAAPMTVAVTPPTMAVGTAPVPQWHSASLALAVKPPIS